MPGSELVCLSSLHTACGGLSGGQVEDLGDFTLEGRLCRHTSAVEFAPGGLMGHVETPSLPSWVKDLGIELAGCPAIRATGVAGNKTCTYIYICMYVCRYKSMCVYGRRRKLFVSKYLKRGGQ